MRVMCTGRVDLSFILRACSKGADGVFIGGCHLNECNYTTHGNFYALRMSKLCKALLARLGLDPARLSIKFISGGEGTRFAELMNEYSETIYGLGPLGKGEGLSEEEVAFKLEAVTLKSLGTARKITITADNTTVIKGGGSKAAIDGRAEQIRREVEVTDSEYDGEKLQERLAKLVGGVAVVKVGAATESEMKEKKARVEDAMHATKAAVEEGIVAGGGVALLRAIPALDKVTDENNDIQAGINIVRRALEEPLRQIANNAGHEGSVVVNKVKELKGNKGFDAQTEEYTDMLEAGIIDPTKVTLNALLNAASIAGLMLTTEALISEIKEDDKGKMMGGGGGAPGGMPGGMEGMY